MLDYMVMEAVYMRAKKEEQEEQKKAERDRWKSERDGLKQFQ